MPSVLTLGQRLISGSCPFLHVSLRKSFLSLNCNDCLETSTETWCSRERAALTVQLFFWAWKQHADLPGFKAECLTSEVLVHSSSWADIITFTYWYVMRLDTGCFVWVCVGAVVPQMHVKLWRVIAKCVCVHMCFLKSGRAPRKSRGCVCVISRFLPQRHGNYPIRGGALEKILGWPLLTYLQSGRLWHYLNTSQTNTLWMTRRGSLVLARPSPHEPFFKLVLLFFSVFTSVCWICGAWNAAPNIYRHGKTACLSNSLVREGCHPSYLLAYLFSILPLPVFPRQPSVSTGNLATPQHKRGLSYRCLRLVFRSLPTLCICDKEQNACSRWGEGVGNIFLCGWLKQKVPH